MSTKKTEDRRVRRTKRNLRENLFILLHEKPLNQITVTELTNLADINRSTFYLYYNDIFDMVEKIHHEVYREFKEQVLSLGDLDSEDYLSKCLQFCKENPTVCKFVVDEHTGNKLAVQIRESILTFLSDSYKLFGETDARRYSTTFLSAGILSVIRQWISDDMIVPVDDMASFLNQLYIIAQKSKNEV